VPDVLFGGLKASPVGCNFLSKKDKGNFPGVGIFFNFWSTTLDPD
jgi:hypothetical protein